MVEVNCANDSKAPKPAALHCNPQNRGWLDLFWLSDLTQASDGSFYFIGTKGKNLTVFKTDAEFNHIWTYKKPTQLINNGRAVFISQNDEVFICGNVYETNSNFPSIYVAQIGENGALKWENFYGLGGCNNLRVTKASEMFVVGHVRLVPTSVTNAWIGKLSLRGDLLGSWTSETHGDFKRLREIENGNLLAFGFQSLDQKDFIDQIWIKFDTGLTVQNKTEKEDADLSHIEGSFKSGHNLAPNYLADFSFYAGDGQYLAVSNPYFRNGLVIVSAHDESGELYWNRVVKGCKNTDQRFHSAYLQNEILIFCGSQIQKLQIQPSDNKD